MTAPRDNSLWRARRGRSIGFDAHVACFDTRPGRSDLCLPSLHVWTRWSDPAHEDVDHLERHQTTVWGMSLTGRNAAERIVRDIAFKRPVVITEADDVFVSIGAAHRDLVTVDCDCVEIHFHERVTLFGASRGNAREMWS